MKREPQKQVKVRSLLVAALILALVAIWVLWSQWDRLRDAGGGAAEESTLTAEGRPAEGEEVGVAPAEAEEDTVVQGWTTALGGPPRWPGDLDAPASCEAVEGELARVCGALESRESLAGIDFPGGLCGLVRQSAEELAARPPAVGSELRSYATILSNTFHLFRTLGRDRIEPLRRAAASNDDLAEPAALALYRWLISRERCARSGRTAIRAEPLYDYAGFLFQTLGGQAYLRRRAPKVEALVSFYALLLMDRSIERNHNPHGLDPRPEIRRTRALLEAQPLVFRDRYLALLDELDRKWPPRENE